VRLFLGVVVGQIASLAMASDQAKALLALAGSAIHSILGSAPNFLP
jgi:hypothetical protein